MKIARDFSEFDCLRRLKLDNGQAGGALFRHYSALVDRFAYGCLKSRTEAEEIVPDCFLTIWEKRPHLRDDVPLRLDPTETGAPDVVNLPRATAGQVHPLPQAERNSNSQGKHNPGY